MNLLSTLSAMVLLASNSELVCAKPPNFYTGFTSRNIISDLQSGAIDSFIQAGGDLIKITYEWGTLQPQLFSPMNAIQAETFLSAVKNITSRPDAPHVVLQMSSNNSFTSTTRTWFNYGLFQGPASPLAYTDFFERFARAVNSSLVTLAFSETPTSMMVDATKCNDTPTWIRVVNQTLSAIRNYTPPATERSQQIPGFWIPVGNEGSIDVWNTNFCGQDNMTKTVGEEMRSGWTHFSGPWVMSLNLDDTSRTSACNGSYINVLLNNVTTSLRNTSQKAIMMELSGNLTEFSCRQIASDVVNYLAKNNDVWTGVVFSQDWNIPKNNQSRISVIPSSILDFIRTIEPTATTTVTASPTPNSPVPTVSSIRSEPSFIPSPIPKQNSSLPSSTPPLIPNFLQGSRNTPAVGIAILCGVIIPVFFIFVALLYYFVVRFRRGGSPQSYSGGKRFMEPILKG